MFARYASAVTTGTLVTFALLYAMQSLIDLQPGVASDGPDRNIIDWVSLPRDDKPPPPPKPEFTKKTLSKAPVPPSGLPNSNTGTGVYIPVRPAGPGPIDTKVEKLRTPDGPLIAIVRVQPTYPARAQAQELEGWVDVRFDVLTNGQVVNIIVTASSNSLFEKAAIRAAERFRFKAPVVDGIPQIAQDVDYRFRFEMDN